MFPLGLTGPIIKKAKQHPKGRPMKKLVRAVQKVNTEVVGLDVHQDLIVYTWMDRHGNEVEQGKLAGTPTAILGLLKRIGETVHVAFEAGGSMFWIYDLLVSELGKQYVHVVQAKKIRAIANSTEKNDFNDSWWLAYLLYEGRLPESFVPTGVLRELRIAVRERFEVVQSMTRAKVRLRSHLRQMGVRLSTRKLESIASWNELIDLGESRAGVQGQVILHYLSFLEHLFAARDEWEQTISTLAKDLPAARVIEAEMPGFGPVLAAVVVAELGPIERFTSAKAMARYTGLTPSDRSSAGKAQPGSITREGSEHLRWALTQAAMACLRSRSGAGLAVGDWIRAKEKRLGCKGKARVAGARKLCESIWRLFHLGECFDAAKPFGGVTEKAI